MIDNAIQSRGVKREDNGGKKQILLPSNKLKTVFAKLDELEKCDELLVTDENGKNLKFKVTETASYKLEEFPLKAVFGANTKSRLNLITCEGVFDKSSRLYSHRLVVYSELVD